MVDRLYSPCWSPLSVLPESFQLYVKCNPSHGVRRLRALILFRNPYAHTLPVPHHCCKVHSIDMLFMQHNWLIVWSFPPFTERPDTPIFLWIFLCTHTLSFLLSCLSSALPASVNWAYSAWLDLTWKLNASYYSRVLEPMSSKKTETKKKRGRSNSTTITASLLSYPHIL